MIYDEYTRFQGHFIVYGAIVSTWQQTLSNMQNIFKYLCCQKEKLNIPYYEQFLLSSQIMFSTLFNNTTFIYSDFPYFCIF